MTAPLTSAARRVLAGLLTLGRVKPSALALHLRMGEPGVASCLRHLRARGLAETDGQGMWWVTAAGRAEVARAVVA